jgi:single-strand DNA-binding protein
MSLTEAQHKNEVHLAGVLAKDPIIRATASGQKVVTLTVATKFKERTEYHRVVCWDAVADKAEKCHKGEFVKIVGRLQTRSWEDKASGQKRYSTEVVAWQLVIPDKDPVTTNIHGVEVFDADIPF